MAYDNNYAAEAPIQDNLDHPEIIAQDEEWHDLSPIEKKLCFSSLGLGIALLAVFVLAFRV